MSAMKPTTTDEVLEVVDAAAASAALGAGLELGVFWLLDTEPMEEKQVVRALGVPPGRCGYWLDLLCGLGLVEREANRYRLSETGRSAIVGSYSPETWSLMAQEARERGVGLRDLPIHIREPGSVLEALGEAPRSYVTKMTEDPVRARRFTRMLYELHRPLAERVADALDLSGADRLMDLGGGSGVMSMALVQKYPGLRCTVVDIPNVCLASREIIEENRLTDRISHYPADILRHELPGGFDAVLECDVDLYEEPLFQKVREALDPGGTFIIVDQFAPARGTAPPSRLHWAFQGSLVDPRFEFPTTAQVAELLEKTGFNAITQGSLEPEEGPCERFLKGMGLIRAVR